MTDTPPLATPTLTAPAVEQVIVTLPAPAVSCPVLLTAAGPAAEAAWEQFASDEDLAPSTRLNYARWAEQFLDWLHPQSISLTQITPAVVNEFLTTRYHCRAALRRLFNALVTHGVMAESPIAGNGPRYRGATHLPTARIDPGDDDVRLPVSDLSSETAFATGTTRPSRPNTPMELHIRLDDDATEFRLKGVLTRADADRLFRLITSHIDEDDESEPRAALRHAEPGDAADKRPALTAIAIEKVSEGGG